MKSFDKSKLIFSAILGLTVAGLLYYFCLPAINVHSYGFWLYLTAVLSAFSLPWWNFGIRDIIASINNAKYSKYCKMVYVGNDN